MGSMRFEKQRQAKLSEPIRDMSSNQVRNSGPEKEAEWSAKMRIKCNSTSKMMN